MTNSKNKKTFYNRPIPSGWEVKKLGEVLTLKRGYDLTGNERVDGTVPVISSSGFNGFHNVSMVKAPGIVMGRYGTVGEIFYIEEDFWPHNTTLYVSVFKLLNPLFAYYLLQSINYDTYSGKSAVPGINRNDLHIEKILLPPPPEQKAIAHILSMMDTAINKNNQLITEKELRKKWLMKNLLTGKKRLKGFDGEWKEYSYEELLKVVKRNFDWEEKELYKLISVRRRSGGIFFREALYGNQILVKTLRTANEGDFLFSKMQILHGASALVTKEFDGAKISGSYIAVISKEAGLLNMEFFQWYSRTSYFYHQTYISSYGVHIEKMTFDFENFLQLEMSLPSFKEQTAIAQVLQAADKEIKLLKIKTEKLREQKKGMMQVLLTGKKRLKLN